MSDVPVISFGDHRIDMAHWFPKLRELDVPSPTTIELPLDHEQDPPRWDHHYAVDIVDALGGRAFVRAGYASSRYPMSLGGVVRRLDPDHIELVILDLASNQKMMRVPLGESFWIREYLDLDFCVWDNETLHPEVRVFIRDNEIVCHHPRHETESVYSGDIRREIANAWDGAGPKHHVRGYAERVADSFDGWWTVDFVMDREYDWYATDMAPDAVYDADEAERESVSGYQGLCAHPGDCEHDIMNLFEESDDG